MSTATNTDGCYISQISAGLWLRTFPQLSPVGTHYQATLAEDTLTGADVAETERKTFPAMAAVSELQFQPSAATIWIINLLPTDNDIKL